MKLNEFLKRINEYNSIQQPPVHNVDDELDQGIVATPEIESNDESDFEYDNDTNFMEKFNSMVNKYFTEEGDEDEDEDEDDYDAEEDVFPDDLKELQKVTVVRHGQKMKVLPPKKGYKRIGNKYEKMSAQEQKTKSKIAKKGWKKKKPKIASINKAKAKSMKRRKSI